MQKTNLIKTNGFLIIFEDELRFKVIHWTMHFHRFPPKVAGFKLVLKPEQVAYTSDLKPYLDDTSNDFVVIIQSREMNEIVQQCV